MAQVRYYGNPLAAGLEGATQVISVPTPPMATAPIQVRRWVRGGLAPDATFIDRIRDAANYAVMYRSKQVWGNLGMDGGGGPVGGASGATLVIHRFACFTGPFTHAWLVRGVIYPPLGSATGAKVTVNVYSDAAMTTLVGSFDLIYGAKPSGISFGWRMARVTTGWIDGLSPSTAYYCSITATDSAKVGGISVFDMQSLTENGAGYYATNLTTHTPIRAADRLLPHTALKSVWTKGGAHVLNWSSTGGDNLLNNQDASGVVGSSKYITSTSTTLTNVVDRTSTTISSHTPGYTLDMTYKDRVSQTSGVPCKIAVWGYATAPADLNVVLKNSAGTTIATVSGFSATAGWVTASATIPATVDKYDLQFKTTSAGVRAFLGAVSIWEQE